MTVQLKSVAGPIVPTPAMRNGAPFHTVPWTTEERLERIVAMSQQINGYIEFMSKPGDLKGTSGEARDNAVRAFYERMVIIERQLARTYGDFRLA